MPGGAELVRGFVTPVAVIRNPFPLPEPVITVQVNAEAVDESRISPARPATIATTSSRAVSSQSRRAVPAAAKRLLVAGADPITLSVFGVRT